jgi:drug/metabolite transporter (DMT)-like permease
MVRSGPGNAFLHDVAGRTRLLAVLALAGTTLLWGSSFVAGKVVLEEVPPITLALLRFVVALAVLVPLLRWRGGRPIAGRNAALLGLTGMALFFICQNLGLRLTGATDATLINNGAFPVLTGLLAAAMLGERLGGRLLGGLSVSVAGVVAVSLADHDIGFSVLGDGLILASVACGALYVVLGRRCFADGDWLAILVGAMGFGALFLLPAAAVEIAIVGIAAPDPGSVLLIVYLGVGCSALAFALWAYALTHLAAAQVAVIGNVEVPVGVIASALILGEGITPPRVIGTALVLAGAWMATERAGARDATMESVPELAEVEVVGEVAAG